MRTIENHGTPAGYVAHRKRNEDSCDPCLKAHNAYNAASRRRARALARAARAIELANRDLCSFAQCTEDAAEDGWCWGHAADESAIVRACHGDPVGLLPHERTEAVRRLTRAGVSVSEIARTLGVTTRTVTRHRTKQAEQVAA